MNHQPEIMTSEMIETKYLPLPPPRPPGCPVSLIVPLMNRNAGAALRLSQPWFCRRGRMENSRHGLPGPGPASIFHRSYSFLIRKRERGSGHQGLPLWASPSLCLWREECRRTRSREAPQGPEEVPGLCPFTLASGSLGAGGGCLFSCLPCLTRVSELHSSQDHLSTAHPVWEGLCIWLALGPSLGQTGGWGLGCQAYGIPGGAEVSRRAAEKSTANSMRPRAVPN